MRRFFVEGKILIGAETVIAGVEARHLSKVLRLGPGDGIVVFDGAGFDYRAEITSVSRDRVTVAVRDKYPSRPESRARITVAQALLKGRKMDLLVRQMTELGVAAWVPFEAERSVVRSRDDRAEERLRRWRAIVKEALKQSRRGEFTRVHPVTSFEAMLQMGESGEVKLIFWEKAAEPLERLVRGYAREIRDIWVVLGPEGGFSPEEIETARSHGFAAAGLGSRILRAETASLAVCILMQHLFGDLGRE